MGSGGKGPNAPTRGDTSSSRNSPTGGGDKKTPSTNTNRSNESSNGQGSRKDSGGGKDSTRRDSGQSGTRKDAGNDRTRRDGSKQDTGSRKGDDSGSRKGDDGSSRRRDDDGPSSRSDSRDSTPSGRRDNGNQPDSGPRRDSDSQKDSGPRKDSSDSTDSGPRKDGTDSKDNTSTSRRDDNQDDRGGTDGPDGGRPPSPKTLEEFKSHTWGNKDNPANQQAFRDDLRRLLNDNKPGQKYNEFFKEFYKENSGHRKKADTTIGPDEWGLPRILRDENGDWVPLKPAEQPTYLGEKTSRRMDDPKCLPEKKSDLKKEELRKIERREKLKKDLRELDKTAKERRTLINASMAAWDHLKKMEILHGEYNDMGPNHP